MIHPAVFFCQFEQEGELLHSSGRKLTSGHQLHIPTHPVPHQPLLSSAFRWPPVVLLHKCHYFVVSGLPAFGLGHILHRTQRTFTDFIVTRMAQIVDGSGRYGLVRTLLIAADATDGRGKGGCLLSFSAPWNSFKELFGCKYANRRMLFYMVI